MNPSLATLICVCGIAALFYLDRDKSLRVSKALWLPVIWVGIAGSRPASEWLGVSPATGNVQLDGSPLDAALFGVLLVAAIGVLIRRGSRTKMLLTTNWLILAYFSYCLISVVWSYHPDVALKRWIKAIGDLAMCLVIVTETQPAAALGRLISRLGFVLLPTSVLFIKYYGDLGSAYAPDGMRMNTGVTTNKNMLGVMLLVVSLFTLWRVIALLRAKGQPNRNRHLLAQGTLLACGIVLFQMADSQTSIACFTLGSGLIVATNLRAIKSRPARVHVLCLLIVIIGLALFFGGQSAVVQAMGRKSNFSGRTDIWAALIPTVSNPIVGAGFESYWISPNVLKFQQTLNNSGWWHAEGLNEAHNGYLEVYLNLGCVGVVLISSILISGYRRAVAAFRLNPSIGGLMLAYIIPSAVYSSTEAGFRMLDPMWIFLLLAIVSANGVTAGFFSSDASNLDSSGSLKNRRRARTELIPKRETVYT